MNFIARHIQAIGLLLLTTVATAAVCLYWDVPARVVKPPVAQAAAKFSCPMHSEVVLNRPGACPKCGMALKEAAAATGEPAECDHSTATGDSAPSPSGCAHTASSGPCCPSKAQPATIPLPSGCTRNVHDQPASPSQ